MKKKNIDRISKGSLAIILSGLAGFSKPNERLEQYETDSETASEIIFIATGNGDIEGKIIADFGCGTGILGIGAMLVGAKKVIFVEKDPDAIETLKKNLKTIDKTRLGKYSIHQADILSDFNQGFKLCDNCTEKNIASIGDKGTRGNQENKENKGCSGEDINRIDTIIQNPPFGSRITQADRQFINNAAKKSRVIWSIHPKNALGIIERELEKNQFEVTHTFNRKMHLRMKYAHHTNKKRRTDIIIIRAESKII